MLRSSDRQWLWLPNDSPLSYFHAAIKKGTISIPCSQLLSHSYKKKLALLKMLNLMQFLMPSNDRMFLCPWKSSQ